MFIDLITKTKKKQLHIVNHNFFSSLYDKFIKYKDISIEKNHRNTYKDKFNWFTKKKKKWLYSYAYNIKTSQLGVPV